MPLEPLPRHGDPEHAIRRILRGSLDQSGSTGICCRRWRATTSGDEGLIAADSNEKQTRLPHVPDQDREYLESTLGSPDGVNQTRSNSRHIRFARVYGDLTRCCACCAAATPWRNAKMHCRPPSTNSQRSALQIAECWVRSEKPTPMKFPSLGYGDKRLKTPGNDPARHMAAQPRTAADIAPRPVRSPVSMVLDRLDDNVGLRRCLKNDAVLVAKGLLLEIYDTEDRIAGHIDRLDESELGKRPEQSDERDRRIGGSGTERFRSYRHVLASHNLRGLRPPNLAGRLTNFWEERARPRERRDGLCREAGRQ